VSLLKEKKYKDDKNRLGGTTQAVDEEDMPAGGPAVVRGA